VPLTGLPSATIPGLYQMNQWENFGVDRTMRRIVESSHVCWLSQVELTEYSPWCMLEPYLYLMA
jgi:hypothetical protein